MRHVQLPTMPLRCHTTTSSKFRITLSKLVAPLKAQHLTLPGYRDGTVMPGGRIAKAAGGASNLGGCGVGFSCWRFRVFRLAIHFGLKVLHWLACEGFLCQQDIVMLILELTLPSACITPGRTVDSLTCGDVRSFPDLMSLLPLLPELKMANATTCTGTQPWLKSARGGMPRPKAERLRTICTKLKPKPLLQPPWTQVQWQRRTRRHLG